MIIRKLEYLLALAKEGHFARAAAACHVSQPALSAGIQQLEIELGVPIVKRGQRFQGFTQQGEVVLAWAQRLALECQHLHQELRDLSAKLAGTLRIGVLHSAVPLASILGLAFERAHPKISLSLLERNAFDIQQGLEDFTLDVGITYLDEKMKRGSSTHPFYRQEYDLLVRRGTKWAAKKSVSWDDVRQMSLCLLTEQVQALDMEVSHMLSDVPEDAPHVETNNTVVLLDHVRSGKWVSVLPRTARLMIANDPTIEAISLPLIGEPVFIGIAVPRREPECPLAEVFFEIATQSDVLYNIQDSLRVAPQMPTVVLRRPAS